jgi:citrate lyase subunit beta / citryl-CoA lyase
VARRSQLYVPGNNEKMIAKSQTLDADSIILDLEDAVPQSEKAEARRLVCRLARELDWGARELCVRVNPIGSREFGEDIVAIKKVKRVETVLIPKAEQKIPPLASSSGKALMPIIETATGLLRGEEVVGGKRVVAVTYGAADYAASVGGSVSAYLGNEAIKTMIVAIARSRGVEAIDNVYFDIENPDGFRKDALAARSLGFTGKQVIHPSQIPLANDVFSPTREELEWAERVVEELKGANARRIGAIKVDGKLVDSVHYRMARDIIGRGTTAKSPRAAQERQV